MRFRIFTQNAGDFTDQENHLAARRMPPKSICPRSSRHWLPLLEVVISREVRGGAFSVVERAAVLTSSRRHDLNATHRARWVFVRNQAVAAWMRKGIDWKKRGRPPPPFAAGAARPAALAWRERVVPDTDSVKIEYSRENSIVRRLTMWPQV